LHEVHDSASANEEILHANINVCRNMFALLVHQGMPSSHPRVSTE